jgi:hypothetical protein
VSRYEGDFFDTWSAEVTDHESLHIGTYVQYVKMSGEIKRFFGHPGDFYRRGAGARSGGWGRRRAAGAMLNAK